MERKKASDFPQELLNLLDGYVHGRMSRRDFLDGAQKFAVGGLTATALFEMLKPNYAWAIQVPKDDNRIKAESATVPSPQGNGSIKGYLVRPANATEKVPVVLVIHENRGLNPYIEDVARRLATAGYMAFAPDGLTSAGGYPGDDEKGLELFRNVDDRGVMHFPGFHPDTAAFLIRERRVQGIAVDTLSLDHGRSKDFRTHTTWLPSGRWGLECVANLGQCPPKGATIVVGGPKIQGATGGPSRVFALL